MKRIIRRSTGLFLALAFIGVSLGGCVVYDERRLYRPHVVESPRYYVAGHYDRWGDWIPGHYR